MIHLKLGDALIHKNNCIIAHCCNDIGAYEAGFVASINKISPYPKGAYKKWYRDGYTTNSVGEIIPFKLGNVQFVCLFDYTKSKAVANIIGQHGIGWDKENNTAPVRYWSIRQGLQQIKNIIETKKLDYDVVSPLLGTNLAGGSLEEIYAIIYDLFGESKIDYYMYAFTPQDFSNLKAVAAQFSS